MKKYAKVLLIILSFVLFLSFWTAVSYSKQSSKVIKEMEFMKQKSDVAKKLWKDNVLSEDMKKTIKESLSDQYTQEIMKNIDFSKQGIQQYDLGNGIMFEFRFVSEKDDQTDEGIINTIYASTNSISSTKSGSFYVISTGQTVATYSLAASFLYDPSSSTPGVVCMSTGHTENAGPAGWRISCDYCNGSKVTYYNNHTFVAKGEAKWTLESQNIFGGWSYNNSTILTIYCDDHGNIS